MGDVKGFLKHGRELPSRLAYADERKLGATIRALAREFPRVPLSVDTVKADVARAACDAPAPTGWCRIWSAVIDEPASAAVYVAPIAVALLAAALLAFLVARAQRRAGGEKARALSRPLAERMEAVYARVVNRTPDAASFSLPLSAGKTM